MSNRAARDRQKFQQLGEIVASLTQQRHEYRRACAMLVNDFPEIEALVRDGKEYEREVRREAHHHKA